MTEHSDPELCERCARLFYPTPIGKRDMGGYVTFGCGTCHWWRVAKMTEWIRRHDEPTQPGCCSRCGFPDADIEEFHSSRDGLGGAELRFRTSGAAPGGAVRKHGDDGVSGADPALVKAAGAAPQGIQ